MKPLKMADVFWVELLIYQSHREIIGTSSVLGRPQPWDAMGVTVLPGIFNQATMSTSTIKKFLGFKKSERKALI